MRFDEKLIILRKKQMLSQEGLAEKLDVTRQTVSKWELGQTKPDMDKLTEISKLFNVSIDELTNDEISIEETVKENSNTNKNTNNKGNRKFILYILIIIFIASFVTLTYRIGVTIIDKKNEIKEEVKKKKKEAETKQKEIEEKFKEEEAKQEKEFEEMQAKEQINSFNRNLESWDGTQTKAGVSYEIDDIVSSNQKNPDHLVEVVFDNTSYGTDVNSIKSIKDKLQNFVNYKIQYYEVSIEYNEQGYINKIVFETK